MKFIDEKFWNNKTRYILQCSLATISVFILLLVLDAISDRVIVASLGASSFIVFTMPHSKISSPRLLIGGYVIGILSAYICTFMSFILTKSQYFVLYHIPFNIVFGALSVGISIFLMVITDSEHPPAAALALGLVASGCSGMSVIVSLVGIIALCLIRTLLKRYMINLL